MNATPTASPSTHAKYEFKGTGQAATETFSILTGKWKIFINVTGDPNEERYMTFNIYVYNADRINRYEGDQSQSAVYSRDLHNFGEDYFLVSGAGKYYLYVDSTNCLWKITVTAPP
jgi:hypothetical protein